MRSSNKSLIKISFNFFCVSLLVFYEFFFVILWKFVENFIDTYLSVKSQAISGEKKRFVYSFSYLGSDFCSDKLSFALKRYFYGQILIVFSGKKN